MLDLLGFHRRTAFVRDNPLRDLIEYWRRMRMQQKDIDIDWSYKTHFYKEEQYSDTLLCYPNFIKPFPPKKKKNFIKPNSV